MSFATSSPIVCNLQRELQLFEVRTPNELGISAVLIQEALTKHEKRRKLRRHECGMSIVTVLTKS